MTQATAGPVTRGDESAPRHADEVERVVAELRTDATRGLTARDAAERLETHGRNELGGDEPLSLWRILLGQFTSPLIVILLVAFAVTIVIDEHTDAAVIAAVLVINATIGATQERKADRSVRALMELAAPRSTIVRDGVEQDVDSAELVPGDLVVLTSGSRVPADLRLVSATTLDIDESLLTGESDPTRKGTAPVAEETPVADRTCVAYMGSAVANGRGRGVVIATATGTELGSIAASIQQATRPETPLQKRMRRFANIIAVVVLGATVVAFVLGVALGTPADQMFLTAVALAVAVVPEGLPVAFTVAMALGVHRMAKRNAIIRSLPAVETLGSTDTIGSDKTGTLTANRMTVLLGWTGDGWVSFAGTAHEPGGTRRDARDVVSADPCGALADSLRTAILSSEADLILDGDEIVDHRGDPTEWALLVAAREAGLAHVDVRRQHPELASVPFEAQARCSYVVTDEGDGAAVLRLKGAPERVLELCTSVRSGSVTRPLDLDEVHAVANDMAARGLRVLATAQRRLDLPAAQVDPHRPPVPDALTLTGLVGMQDPPRSGVADAIARCRSAGIRVVMITGDHVATARAIARDLGISGEAQALTGADLERMDDAQLRDVVGDVDVFARVTPDHKLRVVQALQSHDLVVAVTGDGVNDGPALKAADIGVAMGRSGTDVAREASDMVLTDDDFVSIVDAVEEGRVVFDNVRKVTYFLLSTGAASIVAIIASIVAGLPLPYVPAALLWLNVVTNGLQDVALAFDPGERGVLDQPPRRSSEGILSRALWERTVLTGTAMAAGSLWLYTWAIDAGLSPPQQRGAALTTLVIAMAAHAYNARSERRSILVTRFHGNPFLLISTIVAVIVHLLATHWEPTQRVLQIEPVTAAGWARILAVAVAVVLISETDKLLRRRRARA
ncbi:cation-translocating P-type ATPase [Nitriliruptor alkaliphilus]|uniref:cation-translocating P-type ATPase n=1 Tax=Nitriliruptor alkaliphilus TaxID=427918 RepID=UPI00069696EB|nr:HAD-IC family P-type ATPase [Nitriliruptor alkaliphilus]